MPVLYVKDGSGEYQQHWVKDDEIESKLSRGQWFADYSQDPKSSPGIYVTNEEGDRRYIPFTPRSITKSLQEGYRWETPRETDVRVVKENYEAEPVMGRVKAGLSGLGAGATLGLSKVIEPRDAVEQEALESAFPGTYIGSELLGGVATAIPTGGGSIAGRGALALGKKAATEALKGSIGIAGKVKTAADILAHYTPSGALNRATEGILEGIGTRSAERAAAAASAEHAKEILGKTNEAVDAVLQGSAKYVRPEDAISKISPPSIPITRPLGVKPAGQVGRDQAKAAAYEALGRTIPKEFDEEVVKRMAGFEPPQESILSLAMRKASGTKEADVIATTREEFRQLGNILSEESLAATPIEGAIKGISDTAKLMNSMKPGELLPGVTERVQALSGKLSAIAKAVGVESPDSFANDTVSAFVKAYVRAGEGIAGSGIYDMASQFADDREFSAERLAYSAFFGGIVGSAIGALPNMRKASSEISREAKEFGVAVSDDDFLSSYISAISKKKSSTIDRILGVFSQHSPEDYTYFSQNYSSTIGKVHGASSAGVDKKKFMEMVIDNPYIAVDTVSEKMASLHNVISKSEVQNKFSQTFLSAKAEKMKPHLEAIPVEKARQNVQEVIDSVSSSLKRFREDVDKVEGLMGAGFVSSGDILAKLTKALDLNSSIDIHSALSKAKSEFGEYSKAINKYIGGKEGGGRGLSHIRDELKNFFWPIKSSLIDESRWGQAAVIDAYTNQFYTRMMGSMKILEGFSSQKAMKVKGQVGLTGVEDIHKPQFFKNILEMKNVAGNEEKRKAYLNFLKAKSDSYKMAKEYLGVDIPSLGNSVNELKGWIDDSLKLKLLTGIIKGSGESNLLPRMIRQALFMGTGLGFGGIAGGALGFAAESIASKYMTPKNILKMKIAVEKDIGPSEWRKKAEEISKSIVSGAKKAAKVGKTAYELPFLPAAIADWHKGEHPDTDKAFEESRKIAIRISEKVKNSGSTINVTLGRYSKGMSDMVVSSSLQAQKISDMLSSSLPKKGDFDFSGKERGYIPKADKIDMIRKLSVAISPDVVVEKIKNGTASRVEIESLATIHPRHFQILLETLIEKANEGMIQLTPIISMLLGEYQRPVGIPAMPTRNEGQQQKPSGGKQLKTNPKLNMSAIDAAEAHMRK